MEQGAEEDPQHDGLISYERSLTKFSSDVWGQHKTGNNERFSNMPDPDVNIETYI